MVILFKDSQNKIFVTGNNSYGQLGTGKYLVTKPSEMNSQYFTIWRNNIHPPAKSARK